MLSAWTTANSSASGRVVSARLHRHSAMLTRMTENECGVETRKDGTLICSLHKEPLTETTRLEKEEDGKSLAHFNTRTFFCLGAKKEFTIESPLWRAS
jgi:hypothetical protein